MRELDSLTKQTEITALTIHERIARIHDALRILRDMTLMLYEATPRLTPDRHWRSWRRLASVPRYL